MEFMTVVKRIVFGDYCRCIHIKPPLNVLYSIFLFYLYFIIANLVYIAKVLNGFFRENYNGLRQWRVKSISNDGLTAY